VRTTTGARAYVLREIAELALLIAVLAFVSRFVHVPVWVLIGLPSAKILGCIAMYTLFMRRSLLRSAHVGPEALVGRIAETITSLDPSGRVKLNGEIWTAVSYNGVTIPPQHRVEIQDVRGNTLHVRIDAGEGR
jgi:membrane protein implicated in regulation of membrane protease activity